MSRVKFGHYVPQLHLRYFAHAGEKRLHCFDKTEGKVLIAPVNRVAAERNFYDLVGQAEQFAERTFNDLEGATGTIYKRIATAPREDITENDLKQLAPFVATQLLRTRVVRDNIVNVRNESRQAAEEGRPLPKSARRNVLRNLNEVVSVQRSQIEAMTDPKRRDEALKVLEAVAEEAYEDVRKGRFPRVLANGQPDSVKDDQVKRSHLQALANSVTLQTEALLSSSWTLIKPPRDERLWTTDNPVVRLNSTKRIDSDAGFSMVMPLTPTRGIGIMNIATLPSSPVVELTSDEVFALRRLQILQSTRFVMASDGDFAAARELLSKEPQLSKPFTEPFGGLSNLR